MFSVAEKTEAVSVLTSLDTSADAKVAKLVEMGFTADAAQKALRQTGSDLESACELLAQDSFRETLPVKPISSGFSSLMRYRRTYNTCIMQGVMMHACGCFTYSYLPGYKRQNSIGAQFEIYSDELKDPEVCHRSIDDTYNNTQLMLYVSLCATVLSTYCRKIKKFLGWRKDFLCRYV